MQAVSEEENENLDHALTLYTDAAEICLEKVYQMSQKEVLFELISWKKYSLNLCKIIII